MAYNKILIAVDDSEYAKTAAKKGLELAQQLAANVALLFVVDISKTVSSNVDAGITPESALLVLKNKAQQTLDELSANTRNLTKFMPEGHPKDEIIKMAETWQADLIVIGTHGKSGLLHLLVGSVADHVIHHAKIPVMVIPSQAKS